MKYYKILKPFAVTELTANDSIMYLTKIGSILSCTKDTIYIDNNEVIDNVEIVDILLFNNYLEKYT